jgi:hypothetical protein
MWTCPQCHEGIEDQFDSCWKCGTPNPAVKPVGASGRPAEAPGLTIAMGTSGAGRSAGSSAEIADPRDALTEEEVTRFVGSNSEYYLRKWDASLKGRDGDAGFNWAAFFLGPFWLPYRRLYLHAIALYAAMFLLVIQDAARPNHAGNGLGLLLGVVCGVFGNRWYYTQVHGIITQTRSLGLAREAYLDKLARRGGTNPLAPFVFFGAFFALVFACLYSRVFS